MSPTRDGSVTSTARDAAPPRRGRCVLALLAILLPLYGLRLGAAPLFDRDEAFYIESAREMAGRGNWLTPWFNDQARFDKPILYYWSQLASRAALGESEVAARVPSALALLVLSLGIFAAVEGIAGTRAAFIAALLVGISGESLALGRLGIPDATFALFLTASWLTAFAWVEGILERRSGATVLAVFLALAVLTKGVVAPVLLGLALAGQRLWCGPFRRAPDRAAILRVTLVGAAVAAPWFVAETILEGWEFPKVFFFKHHLERFVSGLPGHDKPWWYFATNVPFLFLPAILHLPASWRSARRARGGAEAAIAERFARMALVWFATVLIFFSLSKGKLANYVFPALPAAAIAAALEIDARWSGRRSLGRSEHVAVGVLGLCAIACLLLSGSIGHAVASLLDEETRAQFPELGWVPLAPSFVLATLATLAARALGRRDARRFFALAGAAFTTFALFIALFAMPAFGEQMHGDTRDVARRIGTALAHQPGRILQYRFFRPTMVYYARHPISTTKDRAVLEAELANPAPLFIATLRKHLAREPIPGVTEIGGSSRFVVLANPAAVATLPP